MSQCGKNNPNNYRLPCNGNSWFCDVSAFSYEKPRVAEGPACHSQHVSPPRGFPTLPLDFEFFCQFLLLPLCADPLVYGHASPTYSHMSYVDVFCTGIHIYAIIHHSKTEMQAMEMTHWIQACAAHAEKSSSVLSTCVEGCLEAACDSSSWDPKPSFGFLSHWHQMCIYPPFPPQIYII